MIKKILIADDETRMRILISDFLSNEGYEVVEAADGQKAIDKFTHDTEIKLVILDVMMPYLDGWQVCEEIRRLSTVPIIMLTAKTNENDELHGFKKGADEYIKKPFSPSILVARVNAIMKRTYEDNSTVTKGLLTIDKDKHTVKCANSSLDLSSTEYKLLLYMIDSENIVLTREQLLDNVWGFDYEGTYRTIDTHINRLRDKLALAGRYIKTVRGYGYKFEVLE